MSLEYYLVVAYDIEDNPTRSKLATLLQYYGLTRIQYSVFAGAISEKNMYLLSDEIMKRHDMGADDNVTIIPLCKGCKGKVKSFKPLPEEVHYASF